MEHELEKFIKYIKNEKHMSVNTELSYTRDLKKFCQFEQKNGVLNAAQLTSTNLTSFILDMEQKGFSPATISRTIASVKAFVTFLVKEGKLKEDISVVLKAPKLERKQHQHISEEEIEKLLSQPDTNTPKGMRDRAMLELLYSAGIRVTQLIELDVEDVNLKLGFVKCDQRSIPLNAEALNAVSDYIGKARHSFLKLEDNSLLFYNCSGSAMSRQGFWKMLKGYANQAEIESEITPHTIRSAVN